MIDKFPFEIYCNNKNYFFNFTYQVKKISCKNKWGFFFSNLVYDLNEIPVIEINKYNNYIDNLYFYIDFFKNPDLNIDKKIYNIHVKINKNLLDINNIKIICINGMNKRIFATGEINIEKKEAIINNKSKTIKIINFL